MSNALIYFYSLAFAGGAERMTLQLANSLSESEFNITLLSLDKPGTKSYYQINEKINYLQIGRRQSLIGKIFRIFKIYRHLNKNKIGIVIGMMASNDKTLLIASKLAGVRLIIAERNAPDMYHIRYSWLQRIFTFNMMRLADRISIQFENFKDKYPPYLHGRMVTIPNPVPQPLTYGKPNKQDSFGNFILLAVSRLDEKQKGILCLVRAFSYIANHFPKWNLRIIGDGPELLELLKTVSNHNLSTRIFFEPSRKNIFDAYLESHLFVIPSIWEGFPNALAEAMAHGIPAVGFSDAAGVSDLIDGSTGWLAPGSNNPISLAKTLSEAMSNHQERAVRGTAAVFKMKGYTHETQHSKWIEMIRRVMRES